MDRIAELVEGRAGGSVFTANVDHVVKAERNDAFRAAYGRASLVLADGKPLVWASRLLGEPLPEKVSGSDLIVPLARLAGERRWRVYVLGGQPAVATEAAAGLRDSFGVDVVGVDSPWIGQDGHDEDGDATLARLTSAEPDVVLVAFGAPKQELWIDRFLREPRPTVAIGVGGSLDFFAGRIKRAPTWMSEAGLEWLYRLLQEPRRDVGLAATSSRIRYSSLGSSLARWRGIAEQRCVAVHVRALRLRRDGARPRASRDRSRAGRTSVRRSVRPVQTTPSRMMRGASIWIIRPVRSSMIRLTRS